VLNDLPTKLPLLKNSRSLEELVQIAKNSRADLNAFQAEYQQRYYEYQKSLADFWPKLSANYDTRNINYCHSSNIVSSHNYDLFLSLDIPLFHGFNDLYQTKKTREQTYAAYEAWAEMDAQVNLDVVTAYYNVQVAEQTLKFSEEFLVFSEQAYQLTLESYKV